MSPRVVVVAGPAGSGKTSRLLAAYRRQLAESPPGAALWLAPTHRAVVAVQSQLVDPRQPACLSPNCLTFGQLSDAVLASAAPKMRALSPLLVRALVTRLVEENVRSGRLEYFAPIAATRGLVDLLVGFIGEAKRLEVWPEELAAAHGPRASQKDRELSAIYEQYQALLVRHDMYDAHGRFWAARALLRNGRWGPLERVRHVFVDGFTDLTRTEHEVLEILATRVESLSISLTWEAESGRDDLFAKTTRTLAELRRRHPGSEMAPLPRRPGPVGQLDHLERRLFANPRAARPAPAGADIEIVAAAGVTHEIEGIARRIKGLLARGADGDRKRVAPGDVLVVFRTLVDVDDLVRDVFTEYGIPHVVASPPALESAPIAAALVAWLRLDAEDWPFRRLLGLLTHNYFQPAWPEWRAGRAAVALERLVRDLEIPSGRDELTRSIERLAARAADAVGQKHKLAPRWLLAGQAAPLLHTMGAALDALPRRATPHEWTVALHHLATEVGLFAAADAGAAPDAATDRIAWQRLIAALAERGRLAQWVDAAPPQWTRRELLEAVEDALAHEHLPLAREEAGRVRVLSAEAARNLRAPYVFLAGLAEKSFPPASREDCLHSDAERRRLATAGLTFAFHALDSRFEMLLFYEMVTRATRRLVLSYPALDPSAQPLTPSPYLAEVERACGGRVVKDAQPHLSSVPPDDDVRSPGEFRLRAVAEALEGDSALLAQWCGHRGSRNVAANALAALRTSAARRAPSFGPFEGLFFSPAAQAKLAERFGPQRRWSPSQLEQYASCPFKFFMASVLHAEPLAELRLAVDYLQRGSMLHWLLSNAHRQLNEQLGGLASPSGEHRERFTQLIGSLVEQLRAARGQRALEGGLLEIDIRQIEAWAERYYQQHVEYDGRWSSWSVPPRPAYFEVAFGPRPGDESADEAKTVIDDADPLSTPEAFELTCGDETIRFAGRIDRIDVGSCGDRVIFNVVDYKSGRGSRLGLQAVYDGRALQLPLYVLAARWLLRDQHAEPFQAGYWHVAGKGYRDKEALKFGQLEDGHLQPGPEWDVLETQIRRRVRSLVEGIRTGQFPMHSSDEHCTSHCPYRTVCRVNQVRSLQKTWQPPGEETP